MNTDENNFNSLFAKNLRFFLEKNNMTQLELSKKLNVGTTSVYNWCNGIKTPRMDKVDKMCQIFGCRRSDLITDSYVSNDVPQGLELYMMYKDSLSEFSGEATQWYQKFLEAPPNIQAAVRALLGSDEQDP